jgi:hypothetical protein
MPAALDLTGQKFGRLTVVEFARRGTYRRMWRCSCSCGEAVVVATNSLRSGHTRSCGCLAREPNGFPSRTHGASHMPELYAYLCARNRCRKSASKSYHHYGARNIKFLFDSFEQFYAELGPRPSPQHSLDRIDNDGHYEPGNCRWADRVTQANNTRSNRRIEVSGKTLTLTQWARSSGLDVRVITWRLKRGWPPERAVLQPSRLSRPAA